MTTNLRSPRPVVRPDAVAALFRSQFGLATPAQLRGAGVDAPGRALRIDRGEWEAFSPGVVGLCGVPDDWRRSPMAASLASSRVAVTGGTALRLHGIDGFDRYDGLHAVARYGDEPRLPVGFDLWCSRRLVADDLTTVDGIRTTTLATALVHAAPVLPPALFGRAVDDALRRASAGWLQSVAERWSGRGVPGSGLLTAALGERCDRKLPRSWFERLARRMLQEHGLVLEHEVEVRDEGSPLAVVDLADTTTKVGIECQSWAWHATPAARRADARRKRRLRSLGWEIVELWWSDLGDVGQVVRDVAAAADRQRRLARGGI